MGQLYGSEPGVEGYAIRIPLKMIQLTEKDGKAYPLAFDWEDADSPPTRVKVSRVLSVVPCSEIRSGAVGDRYECEIEGRQEYLYYTRLQPRKWFLIREVGEEEYNAYYHLPGEGAGRKKNNS